MVRLNVRSTINPATITVQNHKQCLLSTVINNRFRKVLPGLIHQDHKGFVGGCYMGEVTRQLYDTIEDAHTHDKKGLIVGIDSKRPSIPSAMTSSNRY